MQDDVKSRKIVNSEPKNGLESRFEKKSSGLCGKWRGITKAAALFKVGRATIYRRLGREDLGATKVEHRERKIDSEALRKDVEENPQARLIERARKFGVRASAICYALKKMKITRKKIR